MGRWMSPDWADHLTDVPYAEFGGPQSLNLYGYERNNPMAKADGDGHGGPGDILEFIEVVRRIASDPGGFAKSLLAGAAKQALWNASNPKALDGAPKTLGISPKTQGPVLNNDVERTGAATFQSSGGAVFFVASLEGEGGEAPETGSFPIHDWTGYPDSVPKPEEALRLVEESEYNSARAAADKANGAIRQSDPSANAGKQIHEIKPVKFGGSPTDQANKVAVTPDVHSTLTGWWNKLMRTIGGK
jgi:hypothetical protein